MEPRGGELPAHCMKQLPCRLGDWCWWWWWCLDFYEYFLLLRREAQDPVVVFPSGLVAVVPSLLGRIAIEAGGSELLRPCAFALRASVPLLGIGSINRFKVISSSSGMLGVGLDAGRWLLAGAKMLLLLRFVLILFFTLFRKIALLGCRFCGVERGRFCGVGVQGSAGLAVQILRG